jgi:hypothetical protein
MPSAVCAAHWTEPTMMHRALDPDECAALVASARWSDNVRPDDSGCLLWIASRDSKGYGTIGPWKAHRVAWVAANGTDVPDGLTIDHLCRTRHCVNPDHLEPVSSRVNTLRGKTLAAAQAQQTHCKNGHLLEGNNLLPADLLRGKRQCRECNKERGRRRYAALSLDGDA